MMENNEFIDLVKNKLQEMTHEKKDAWILEQAMLVDDTSRMDFLRSLSGEKKIIYMPTNEKIDYFINEVKNGGIYVEQRNDYYEVYYNDPCGGFYFLNRIFRGCHDLLRLKQYQQAYEILNRVCQIKFKMVEIEDDEEYECEDFFTIAMGCHEDKFSMDSREIGYDWIEAYLYCKINDVDAKELLEMLENELCFDLYISDFKELIPIDVIKQIRIMLLALINELNGKEIIYAMEDFGEYDVLVYDRLNRTLKLFDDIERNCLNDDK